MFRHLRVSGRIWTRNFAIIGGIQRRACDTSLNKKVSSSKTFDMQIVSGLLQCLFFGHSKEAPLYSTQAQLLSMITGCLLQAACWIGFSIDGLGRTSTFAAESKLLLFATDTEHPHKMAPTIF